MRNPSLKQQISKGTIAVWEGDYKLIYYIDLGENLLFNLRQDPEELNDLFNEETEISQRLLALIKDNLRMANSKIKK